MNKMRLMAVVIGIAAVLAYIWREPLMLSAMQRVVNNNMKADLVTTLPDGLHVALCGAGSPMPDPKRSGPCTAVIAGEEVLVFDAGSGSSTNLGRMQIPQGRIDAIFLTHFHSDHIDGLGELLLQRWIGNSHTQPITVFGPPGVVQVVNGFSQAYQLDSLYRNQHHGDDVAPLSGAATQSSEFAMPVEQETSVVYTSGEVTVHAFTVAHEPVVPAVGYRIEYKGKSVVISGDTALSENLVWAAKNTDILVHEALSPELVGVLETAAKNAGRTNIEKVARDILDYHATPVQAAQSAQSAGARHLVFSHIVPPLPNKPIEEIFLSGVDDAYEGGVTLGQDGTMVSVLVDSGELQARELIY